MAHGSNLNIFYSTASVKLSPPPGVCFSEVLFSLSWAWREPPLVLSCQGLSTKWFSELHIFTFQSGSAQEVSQDLVPQCQWEKAPGGKQVSQQNTLQTFPRQNSPYFWTAFTGVHPPLLHSEFIIYSDSWWAAWSEETFIIRTNLPFCFLLCFVARAASWQNGTLSA